ncbi:unnamed protein product, partial [Mesorhabditis spiculigera]
MRTVLILCLVVAAVAGQAALAQVKIGESTTVDLAGAKSFKRTLRNGDVHLFKVCDDVKDRSPKCTRWTDSKGKVLSNTSPIHAFKNGTLVIEKVTKEDLASYTSPELDAAALKKGSAGVAVSGPQLSLVE